MSHEWFWCTHMLVLLCSCPITTTFLYIRKSWHSILHYGILVTYVEPYTFPDYYNILDVAEEANQQDIQLAYQRQAILYHPDNRNSTNTISEEERALRFQQLADAFYILKDDDRRQRWRNAHADPEQVFGDAYDELMRPAVENPGYLWRIVGGALGFIVANIPGVIMSVYTVFKELEEHHRQAIIDSILNSIQLKIKSKGLFR
ncbi:hypothetical protein BDF22DRAFT_696467 [Syncephalis plumigaleata]|nr:hypothetical protein BDF22DRAFT_696467 [Syncephalis plumigaleata]